MQNTIQNSLHIRKAVLSDAAAISDIETLSSKNPWSPKTISVELNNPAAVNNVLSVESGKIVAFIFSWLYLPELEIQNIATHPDFRRCGFAKLLLENLLKDACTKGVKTAFLEVRSGNLNAIELYRKFGFEVKSIRKKYYSNQENALVMSTELNENIL